MDSAEAACARLCDPIGRKFRPITHHHDGRHGAAGGLEDQRAGHAGAREWRGPTLTSIRSNWDRASIIGLFHNPFPEPQDLAHARDVYCGGIHGPVWAGSCQKGGHKAIPNMAPGRQGKTPAHGFRLAPGLARTRTARRKRKQPARDCRSTVRCLCHSDVRRATHGHAWEHRPFVAKPHALRFATWRKGPLCG